MSSVTYLLVILDEYEDRIQFFDTREEIEDAYLQEAISQTGEPYSDFQAALDNYDWDSGLRDRLEIFEVDREQIS